VSAARAGAPPAQPLLHCLARAQLQPPAPPPVRARRALSNGSTGRRGLPRREESLCKMVEAWVEEMGGDRPVQRCRPPPACRPAACSACWRPLARAGRPRPCFRPTPRSVLIANNGLAAVKFIRSIRSWAYKTFGSSRAIALVAMATAEDIRINAGGRPGALLWLPGWRRPEALGRAWGRAGRAAPLLPAGACHCAGPLMRPPPPLPPPRAEHVSMADQFVEVPGGTNNNNYANVRLIVQTAQRAGVDAVWPGWCAPAALALPPAAISRLQGANSHKTPTQHNKRRRCAAGATPARSPSCPPRWRRPASASWGPPPRPWRRWATRCAGAEGTAGGCLGAALESGAVERQLCTGA
jgi:hypothetical protein